MYSFRKSGSTRSGAEFTLTTRRAVWAKGAVIPGLDPNNYRKDSCGATIRWYAYGDTTSSQGWEIDHILPVSKGGLDDLSNLQPMQWQNNRKKNDDWPTFYCAVR